METSKKYRIGIFCGERLFSWRSWVRYSKPLISKRGTSFSFGPILLYKEVD